MMIVVDDDDVTMKIKSDNYNDNADDGDDDNIDDDN